MPAVPALIMAGTSIYGAYAAHRAAQEAAQRSPEEQAALSSNAQLAQLTAGQGRQMFQTAMPAVQQAVGYYGNLLTGDRAARQAAVSPETQDVSNAYEGANRAVGLSNIRGGRRDMALAENARGRASDIARLTTGVRPMAAQASAGIGSNLIGAAQGAQGLAGGINSGIVGAGFQNRRYAGEMGSAAGQNWGQLFARLMSVYGNRGRGGGMYPTGGSGGSTEPSDDAGWG